MSGGPSDRHLIIVLRLSDKEHQTNSNCLAETVEYKDPFSPLNTNQDNYSRYS